MHEAPYAVVLYQAITGKFSWQSLLFQPVNFAGSLHLATALIIQLQVFLASTYVNLHPFSANTDSYLWL